MNKVVKKVKKLSDYQLNCRLAVATGMNERAADMQDPRTIDALENKLEGCRAVPPTGQVALYFDALLAVTRGEVLAILATPRQKCEALYLALTYKPE